MWLRPQPHRRTDWCVATSGREGAVKELWVVAWKIIAKARVTQAGNLWENCIPLLVGKNLGIALAGSILAWAAVTTWKVRHTFPDFTAALLVVSECLQTASCKYGQLWKSASNQSNHWGFWCVSFYETELTQQEPATSRSQLPTRWGIYVSLATASNVADSSWAVQ